MKKTETRRNYDCNYNEYYTTANREKLHMRCSPCLSESDFAMGRGKTQKRSRIADKIVSEWAFDEKCRRNIEAKEREIKND